jgi:hypothetical protein
MLDRFVGSDGGRSAAGQLLHRILQILGISPERLERPIWDSSRSILGSTQGTFSPQHGFAYGLIFRTFSHWKLFRLADRGLVIERRMTMTKVLSADRYGSRFAAVYGSSKDQFRMNQKITPARASVEAIIADLAERQKLEGKLHFAQIIDLSMLAPVEPYQATLARLRAAALI